jgi:TusA-related sulfurtransferase
MPGTDIMSRNKALIRYTYADLPRGAELRITTTDSASLAAIREFLTAQRGDHRAGH